MDGRGHPQGDLGEPHVIVSGSSRGENPGSLRLCSQQPRRAASQDTLMDPCLSGRPSFVVEAAETRELTVLIWAPGSPLDSSSCSSPIREKPVRVLLQCEMSPDLFPLCVPCVLVPAQQLHHLRGSSFCTSEPPTPYLSLRVISVPPAYLPVGSRHTPP